MSWLSGHVWLLLWIGSAGLIAVIFLLQRLFANRADDSNAMEAAIRGSQLGRTSSSHEQPLSGRKP